jgi:hypothetical protein
MRAPAALCPTLHFSTALTNSKGFGLFIETLSPGISKGVGRFHSNWNKFHFLHEWLAEADCAQASQRTGKPTPCDPKHPDRQM